MNKKVIFISILLNATIGAISFLLSKKISEKKIHKQIKIMGNLNVIADNPNPELYLELDKTAMKKLPNTKYAVFNVRLLTNQKSKNIDA